MKRSLRSRKAKGTAKTGAAPNLPGSHSEAWKAASSSDKKSVSKGFSGAPAGKASLSGGRRIAALTWASGSNYSTEQGRHRVASSSSASISGFLQKRILSALCATFFCGLFVAAMRRIIAQYRRRVVWETVEKPRAAFVIQTAWRKHRQRRRLLLESVSRLIISLMRLKIKRICAAKEKAVLLLQRVFRSQKERHFVHFMYQKMRYNRALSTMRNCINRRVARRHMAFLAIQRDERRVCEERCAIDSLHIIYSERGDLLHIFQVMQTTAPVAFTPLVTRAIFLEEAIRCTGHCPYSPLSLHMARAQQFGVLSFSEPPSGRASSLKEKQLDTPFTDGVDFKHSLEKHNSGDRQFPAHGIDTHSCTSVLHTEEGARQFLQELFGPNLPPCPLARRGLKPSRFGECGEITATKSPIFQMCDSAGNDNIHSWRSIDAAPGREVLSKGEVNADSYQAVPLARPPFGELGASVNNLIDAFIELLVRTEAAERKALESELQSRHKEQMREIQRFAVTLQATHVAPLLYVPLLSSMGETWAVRRAEQLFREEYDERLKIIEEYQATPLRFLDRPILNLAAEERRRRLQERLRTMKEKKEENGKGVFAGSPLAAAAPAPTTAPVDGQGNNIRPLVARPVSVRPGSRTPTVGASMPQFQLGSSSFLSPVPRPPSPPPRKVHDNPTMSCIPLQTSDERTQRRPQKQFGPVVISETPAISSTSSANVASFIGHLNDGVSSHDTFVGSSSGASRDTTISHASPAIRGNSACPSGLLPSLANSLTQTTRSNEVKGGSTTREFYFHSSIHSLQRPTSSGDEENVALPLQKAAVFTNMENDSGCGDPKKTKTGLEALNYCTNNAVPRGVPIPLLRSSRTERSNLGTVPLHPVASEKNLVTRRECGGDYVRGRYRGPSSFVPVSGFTGVDDSLRPVQPNPGGEQLNFRLQAEQGLNTRKARRNLLEMSGAS
ncbi:hypothetical protein C3747_2g624 [Trypanosoma cruzi]|uniref:IQ calmodulin-binding motif domain-containing protein n=2 Tax=Trypanosoma cruzi TaxID=5693 RepID=Q4D2V0_TRYCC|nr:hypothetical protein, conserved [Trypanosoma cruzi]EAN86847.1 hypothetical protein, conserved [Trypanosoma cruzi]PWV21423.1 hypothetical protein C3747_2g624 [Trypanosoma cruzi]|eukprot:XP_808698.1 hypothetical protein [Trypanosoma cruzi strain CL Brener]